MSDTQEAACAALFALASAASAWSNTPSRRLKLWSDVPKEQRPALFQFEGGRDVYTWSIQALPKRAIEAKWFIYFAASDASPGAPQITAMLDALNAAMAPSGADRLLGRNTLGGTAFLARIKDVPLKDPGDLDGDGLLIVQVEIVLP